MIVYPLSRRAGLMLVGFHGVVAMVLASAAQAQAGRATTQAPPARRVASTTTPLVPAKHHTTRKLSHSSHHGQARRGQPKHTGTSLPFSAVGSANAAARVQPEATSWLNAIQQYAWGEGALYQIYTAPGQVTDIVLQDGEELTGSGPVAAGDTARWIIGDTQSGTGATKRTHILVKPTRGDIATNLVINTDRRTYHLELRATPATYMAAVSWTYPADALIALQAAKAEQQKVAPIASGIEVSALNFHYRIEGDRPGWRPSRVFDDGHQAFIEFPDSIATGEMPPLFVIDGDGGAQLVNYRVQGRYMVVDRLFGVAELRLGARKTQQVVRITREELRKGKRS